MSRRHYSVANGNRKVPGRVALLKPGSFARIRGGCLAEFVIETRAPAERHNLPQSIGIAADPIVWRKITPQRILQSTRSAKAQLD